MGRTLFANSLKRLWCNLSLCHNSSPLPDVGGGRILLLALLGVEARRPGSLLSVLETPHLLVGGEVGDVVGPLLVLSSTLTNKDRFSLQLPPLGSSSFCRCCSYHLGSRSCRWGSLPSRHPHLVDVAAVGVVVEVGVPPRAPRTALVLPRLSNQIFDMRGSAGA